MSVRMQTCTLSGKGSASGIFVIYAVGRPRDIGETLFPVMWCCWNPGTPCPRAAAWSRPMTSR